MALTPGTRLGPYDVTAQIGVGGMGEVYRARDTHLDRAVAIKILPEAFATDPERLARFEREAKTLAALNDPHIAQIYGFEKTGDVRALVMELVEGPTLAERIANGPIPIEDALPIARQIADALEAAHEQGIIHRDLKPANIKVREDGVVKVLDFGLAKLTQAGGAGRAGEAGGVSQSPTITSPAMMTGAGVILGTAAYMSPEQAKGREADKRSDIWAFGCVLYEMFTGTRAFGADDLSDTLANVLRTAPDWGALPPNTPPPLRRLLRRCLEKDPRDRLRDIGDARIEIEEAQTAPAQDLSVASPISKPRSVRWRRALTWSLATFAVVVVAIGATLSFRPVPEAAPEVRLEVRTPRVSVADVLRFAISPDGRSIVFPGPTELWLRPLASETARPIPGTENGTAPFWSPDSRSLGFYADQKLKRIAVDGGTAQTLVDDLTTFLRATWGEDGTILYSGTRGGVLYRVSAVGGGVRHPTEATRLEGSERSHGFPHFLPGGRSFLYFADGAPDRRGIYIGSLDSHDTRRLLEVDHTAVFVAPHYVMFGQGQALYAQRLNLGTLELTGDPQLVADRVEDNPSTPGSIGISASSSGLFAYRPGSEPGRTLIWVDRDGRTTATLSAADGFGNSSPRISPDGMTVAIRRGTGRSDDLWLIESARGVLRRLTTAADAGGSLAWSPDGRRLAFFSRSLHPDHNDLFLKPVDGGPIEALLESAENKNVSDWSRDGRFILYTSQNPKTARDVWALSMEGDRKPVVVVRTSFDENLPRFSPDGRWIAYTTNETGRTEVYVQPFPGPGRSWPVSTEGGSRPAWGSDGGEMFYIAADNRMMVTPVKVDNKARRVDVGTPRALFSLRPDSTYDVAGDGQRFLINAPTDDTSTAPITVVVNWKPKQE